MKFGCCSNLLAGGPGGASGTGLEFVERIAAAGFDYVEMPLGVVADLPEPAFDQLLQRLRQSGIGCETCTNLFPAELRLTGPDVDDAAIDRHVATALQRARRMDAEYIVFGSGRSRSVPDDFSRQAAWDQLVSLLQRVAVFAAAARVTIVIEPLRQQESNILNTYAEACRLAEQVAHPAIQALVDYYHLATEREPAQAIVTGAAWLHHVHYASLAGRRFPQGLDDMLNLEFFRALKTVGYDRRISLEAFTDDFDRDAPVALHFLKQQIEAAVPFANKDTAIPGRTDLSVPEN